MALHFAAQGYKRLHIVDLEGARSNRPEHSTWKILSSIRERTGLNIEFGGGIKTAEALERAFTAGVERVICGSVAVTDSEKMEEWLVRYGGDRLSWGADLREGRLAVKGWQQTVSHPFNYLMRQFLSAGLQTVHCTQVACDGMMQGPDLAWYTSLVTQYPQVRFVACGGICTRAHLESLEAVGITQAVVGRAFYEGGLQDVG